MNFNEKQSNEIHEFIMKYYNDEEFKNNVQKLYDKEICKLSILYIYALEEILRYGNKGIFDKFINSKGTDSESKAADLFDNFVKLFIENDSFRESKMEQLNKNPKTLSGLEMLAFKLISITESQSDKMHDEMTNELEYDNLNPILYSTDSQIKATLENLLIGEFIHKMLELPGMKPIKVRQKRSGMIANSDKQFIIRKIRESISGQEYMLQMQQVINNRFVKVKFNVLLGKGEDAFGEYSMYNTNISFSEILGVKSDTTVEDMSNYFADMLKKQGPMRGK